MSAVKVSTTQLRLASGKGIVTRTVINSPPRDALASEIPIIDVSNIFSESLEQRKTVAAQVRDAATNTGFFYIKNHGISSEVTASAYSAALEFFHQDTETKMACKDNSGPNCYYGYTENKTQILSRDEGIDQRESFFWTYDAPIDENDTDRPQYFKERPSMKEFLKDREQFLPPTFAESIHNYNEKLNGLAQALTRTFALSLDQEEDFFLPKVKYPESTSTIQYYPPIAVPSKPSEKREVSIGSHTDFQFFTILWQDNVGGLQILGHDGQWLRAPPVPGTFVVNIADFLQRITNDVYVSNVHRVQNWSGVERLSIPFFFGFNLDEGCGVLKSCIKEGEHAKYEDISCREWVDKRMKDMFTVNNP